MAKDLTRCSKEMTQGLQMTKTGNQDVQSKDQSLDWLHRELFERIPFNVAVIDRDFNIVEANAHFADYFGKWKNKKCYEAYKKANRPCAHCGAIDALIARRREHSVMARPIGGNKPELISKVKKPTT